jgi:hypothetical protein
MPRPLYPRERPGTHCTGSWVGPRAGLDVCEKSHPTCSPKSFEFTAHSAISVDPKTVDKISINKSQTTNSRTHPPTRSLTATIQSTCQINNSLTDPLIQPAAPSISCSVSHSLSLSLFSFPWRNSP